MLVERTLGRYICVLCSIWKHGLVLERKRSGAANHRKETSATKLSPTMFKAVHFVNFTIIMKEKKVINLHIL